MSRYEDLILDIVSKVVYPKRSGQRHVSKESAGLCRMRGAIDTSPDGMECD